MIEALSDKPIIAATRRNVFTLQRTQQFVEATLLREYRSRYALRLAALPPGAAWLQSLTPARMLGMAGPGARPAVPVARFRWHENEPQSMLPNADHAWIPTDWLRDYLLSHAHPVRAPKSRMRLKRAQLCSSNRDRKRRRGSC